jgi:hypothetical protein
MKRIIGSVTATILLCVLAFGALGIGFYHLQVARAEEAIAAFELAVADNVYARLERKLRIAKLIPWVFEKGYRDVRIRRSRIAYLQQNDAAILGETDEGEVDTLGPAYRFIRGNARYRAIGGEPSREKVIRGLEASIRDYAGTIEANPAFADAAFNYEFLVTLRNDIAGGRRPVQFKQKGAQETRSGQKDIYGEEGTESAPKVREKIKVLVPKEGGEDPEKRGQEPSRGSAAKKSG